MILITINQKQYKIEYLYLILIKLIKCTLYFIKPIKTNKLMENQPIQNQSTETYVNPLTAPANYDLTTLLNELKFGRPANDQLLLQKWIDELC